MSTLEVSNLNDGTKTVATTVVTNGSAKAYVHGDTTASISKSFNVSSGTDHGTGDYSYSLVSAMDSNNYSMPCCVRSGTPDRNARRNVARDTASIMAIETSNARTNSPTDQVQNATTHGDLA